MNSMKYTLDEYPTLDLTKKTIWTPTKIEINYFNKINFEKERQLEKERQIEKVRQTKLNVNAQPFTHISYSPPPTPMVHTQFNNQFIPIPQYNSHYGTMHTPTPHYIPQYSHQYSQHYGTTYSPPYVSQFY